MARKRYRAYKFTYSTGTYYVADVIGEGSGMSISSSSVKMLKTEPRNSLFAYTIRKSAPRWVIKE